jgi:flavin-dependent dehydrogenase
VSPLKVAIAGAGFSGAYLARRLIAEGIAKLGDITIYDPHYPRKGCGISPCAWGICRSALKEAAEKCHLDYGDYVFEEFDSVMVEDVRVKADLCTFNKPKFVRDCLSGLNVVHDALDPRHVKADVIVDATAWRKIIGPGVEEITLKTAQVKVPKGKYHRAVRTMIITKLPFKGLGYFWEFPIGDFVHVGYGYAVTPESEAYNPMSLIQSIVGEAACGCVGVIRASSPELSAPLWREHLCRKQAIVAIGESAGCISSATGGGNKEAIEGVEILLKNWEDWEGYARELVKKFEWAHKEYLIIKKLYNGGRVSLRDAITLKKNSKRYGMKVSFLTAIKLARRILRWFD